MKHWVLSPPPFLSNNKVSLVPSLLTKWECLQKTPAQKFQNWTPTWFSLLYLSVELTQSQIQPVYKLFLTLSTYLLVKMSCISMFTCIPIQPIVNILIAVLNCPKLFTHQHVIISYFLSNKYQCIWHIYIYPWYSR